MPHRRNRSDGTNDSRRKFLKASGAGAVALSLAGCSGSDSPQETTEDTTEETETTEEVNTPDQDVTEGGTFVYGMAAKPDSANRMVASSVYSSLALNLIYEYGTALDPVTNEVKPSVYTDWKVENADGEDSKPDVYFNMREGLKWSDGEDFTKEDVLFTYDYIKENEVGNYAGTVAPIKKVEEASNDWDFHMKLSNPVSTWQTGRLGGLPLLPKHKWEGKDYQEYDPMEANENGPVGLGPGTLTQFSPDTSMQVVFDNEHYYDTLAELDWKEEHDQLLAGGPFLDKVNFKIFGSQSAMTQAFFQNEIDTHYGTLKTSRIEDAQDNEGQDLVKGLASGFSYFAWNLRRKPLDDAALRQAMAFMFDEYFWVQRLKNDYVIKGDYAQTPGYPAVRPDRDADEIGSNPASDAFDFRAAESAVPDVEGVQKFLTEGNLIDGSEGTYVGKEFPGSMTGVSTSQSEAKYDYSFGEVKSDVLKGRDGTEKEIRVDGKTIPEVMDGDPITMFIDPPQDQPKEAKAIQRWVSNLQDLGIPIETQALEFNTMSSKVYNEEDFDMYPMGWGGTGPFGSSAYYFFHSDNADDLSEGNSEAFMYNSPGYGLGDNSADDLLWDARVSMDPEVRNEKTAKALERIYLDMPYFVMSYEKIRWPVNSEKFGGFIQNLVDPAYANWTTQANNIHLTE